MLVLWAHSEFDPIGRPTVLREDATGLYTEFKLDAGVPSADRAILQLRSGTISGLSIGFNIVRAGEEAGVRVIEAADLQEFSVVPFPAQATAGVLDAEREFSRKLAEVTAAQRRLGVETFEDKFAEIRRACSRLRRAGVEVPFV